MTPAVATAEPPRKPIAARGPSRRLRGRVRFAAALLASLGLHAALQRSLERITLPVRPPDASLPDPAPLFRPELAADFPNGFVLSDLEASHPEVVAEYITKENSNGWSVVASSSAGEAQAAADAALVEAGLFSGPTAYEKLNTWEYGGKPQREDECSDSDLVCRAIFRVKIAATLKHPTHYAVVQVQKVVTQEAKPGEPPPLPELDTSAPVYSVVLVRDLGDVRLIPFLYFLISVSLFVIFAWTLHNREKILLKNKALAEAAKGA